MNVFLVGGGTGGPTAPLVAVAEKLTKLDPKTKLSFIGTGNRFEEQLFQDAGLKVKILHIPAGKFRRYLSWRNLIDVFLTFLGFCKSLYLVWKHEPDIIFGAGSYVQVPLCWAGYFCRIPVVVHQQDFRILLSTKLTAPIAKIITTSFSYSRRYIPEDSGFFKKFHKSKIYVTGNPVRANIHGGSAVNARKYFGLKDKLPTVLVIGGGSGSLALNNTVSAALPELVKYVQVIHITGGRISPDHHLRTPVENYYQTDFLGSNLRDAYAISDLVVSRAGMSTISELSALGKAAILIPLPKSPQGDNAAFLAFLQSVIAIPQDFLTATGFVNLVRKILWDGDLLRNIKHNISLVLPKNADMKIAKLLFKNATPHNKQQ